MTSVDKSNYEFVGYHRQRHKRGNENYDDVFRAPENEYADNNYGPNIPEIFEYLKTSDWDQVLRKGWDNFDWSESNQYSENYNEMVGEVFDWLNKKGYRWIFVTERRPHDFSGYGDYIYKIYFKRESVPIPINDFMGAGSELAYCYVYNIKDKNIAYEEYDETMENMENLILSLRKLIHTNE